MRSGLPAVSLQEKLHVPRKAYNKSFFGQACSTKIVGYSFSIHKPAKKVLGQYPALLTLHLVNNRYLLFMKRHAFHLVSLVIPGKIVTWIGVEANCLVGLVIGTLSKVSTIVGLSLNCYATSASSGTRGLCLQQNERPLLFNSRVSCCAYLGVQFKLSLYVTP